MSTAPDTSCIADNFSIIDTFTGEDAGVGVSGLSLIPFPDRPFVLFASPKNFINVGLYTAPLSLEAKDEHVFHRKQILTGHSNWINDLSFACTGEYFRFEYLQFYTD